MMCYISAEVTRKESRFLLPQNTKIVSNTAGVTGGVRLWEPELDELFVRRSECLTSKRRLTAFATAVCAPHWLIAVAMDSRLGRNLQFACLPDLREQNVGEKARVDTRQTRTDRTGLGGYRVTRTFRNAQSCICSMIREIADTARSSYGDRARLLGTRSQKVERFLRFFC